MSVHHNRVPSPAQSVFRKSAVCQCVIDRITKRPNRCTTQDPGRNHQHTIIMASKGAAIKLYTNHRCPCKSTHPSPLALRFIRSRSERATYETQGLIVPTSPWPNLASLSRRRSSTSTLLVAPSTSRSTLAAWFLPCPTMARSSPSLPSSRSSSPIHIHPISSRLPPTPAAR